MRGQVCSGQQMMIQCMSVEYSIEGLACGAQEDVLCLRKVKAAYHNTSIPSWVERMTSQLTIPVVLSQPIKGGMPAIMPVIFLFQPL